MNKAIRIDLTDENMHKVKASLELSPAYQPTTFDRIMGIAGLSVQIAILASLLAIIFTMYNGVSPLVAVNTILNS